MRISLVTMLVVLLSSTAVAHAEVYVSFGVGAESILGGDLDREYRADNFSSARLGVGFRSTNFAAEAVGFGTGLEASSDIFGTDAGGSRSLSLGLDLKYHLPLFAGLEGYGRAGLHKSWLTAQEAADSVSAGDYDGSSHVFGLGLDYVFPTATVKTTVWLDYSHQTLSLTDALNETMNGTVDTVTFGVSVGI